jgi:hypothetical protein
VSLLILVYLDGESHENTQRTSVEKFKMYEAEKAQGRKARGRKDTREKRHEGVKARGKRYGREKASGEMAEGEARKKSTLRKALRRHISVPLPRCFYCHTKESLTPFFQINAIYFHNKKRHYSYLSSAIKEAHF